MGRVSPTATPRESPASADDDLRPDAAVHVSPTPPSNGRGSSAQPAKETTTRAEIPDIVVRRLPVYVRTLRGLADQGIGSVSSEELAAEIGVTAAQIRRDLSYFGRFGKQGKGYDTAFLAEAIRQILRLDRSWDVALAGFGNLGRAIVHYRGLIPSSFRIAAIFDHNEEHIGQTVDGVEVQHERCITETIARLGIRIGIVAVPAAAAQEVTDWMIAGGVRAVLNYAPVVLKVPPGVTVREIDPVGALESMTYYLADATEV